MKGQRFPYRTSLAIDEVDHRNNYRPLAPRIPIYLTGRNGATIENMGIIDSGSTETFISGEISEILGLELSEEIKVNTAGGDTIGYESNISIEVPMKHNPVKIINMPCCVLKDFNEIILGRRGFFTAFQITFCEAESWVNLKDVRSKLTPSPRLR
jgi:hypothetical protein